jgi:dienelactone hydrolase
VTRFHSSNAGNYLVRLPAVILIHGSGGVGGNVDTWAKEINSLGVAAFRTRHRQYAQRPVAARDEVQDPHDGGETPRRTRGRWHAKKIKQRSVLMASLPHTAAATLLYQGSS